MKKKKDQKSILQTLFVPYTILFIIAFIIIMGLFVISESERIKKNSFTAIENNVMNISENLDTTIDSLDTVSQNIIYSNLIKKHFLALTETDTQSSDLDKLAQKLDNVQNTKVLYDLLIAMIGPNAPVDQVKLYALSQGVFCVGLDNSTTDDSVTQKSWYSAVISLAGKKYIFRDKDPVLGKYFSHEDGQYFISLSRLYYNSLNVPQGIVEVKKSFVGLKDIINSIHYTYQEKVYIYDSNGLQIYPVEETDKDNNYYNAIHDNSTAVNKDSNIMHLFLKSSNQYLFYNSSEYSEFTTVLVTDNTQIMKPIYRHIIMNIFILLFVCISTIALSYIIAKRICTPLNHMYLQVRSFQLTGDIEQRTEFEDIDTNVTELNTLYQALLKMQDHARISMENGLQLQTREMQSRMLALQAQMNPHFLYNSLSTIQAMADENMNDEIIMMCQNISRILRYISSGKEPFVSLSDEISCTKDYMECMKIRYDNDLSFSFQIPSEMLSCQIPKLCLQLIIENAIKFTTTSRAPWRIEVKGSITSTHWELHIKDNGPGFKSEELQALYDKIAEIDKTGILPNLEISGMGLMNVYIRFKILYDGNHIFRLSNNIPTGAVITIGGGRNI